MILETLLLLFLISVFFLLNRDPDEDLLHIKTLLNIGQSDDVSRPSIYISPGCWEIDTEALIAPFYTKENLRATMSRLSIDDTTPINDTTAPQIASHLRQFGYHFSGKC